MLAVSDNADMLRNKIREVLDILDIEDLKKLYQTIAEIAAEKAVKFADRDWNKKNLSREKINQKVDNIRKSAK